MNEKAAAWVIAIFVIILWCIMVYVVWQARKSGKSTVLSSLLYPLTIVFPIKDTITYFVKKRKHNRIEQGGWVTQLPPYRPTTKPEIITGSSYDGYDPIPSYTAPSYTAPSYNEPSYNEPSSTVGTIQLEAPPADEVF